MAAVQMDYSARRIAPVARAMRAGINREVVKRAELTGCKVPQIIDVVYGNGLADGCFDARPGVAAAISPYRRARQVAMQPLVCEPLTAPPAAEHCEAVNLWQE